MTEETGSNWDRPATRPTVEGKTSADDVAEWKTLTDRVRNAAIERGWSKTEAAKRSGIPNGTFSQWYAGNYGGLLRKQNERVRQWLDNLEAASTMAQAIPQAPGWIETPTAQAVIETLTYAQVLPEMAIINLGSGMGKSEASKRYCATRPHAWLVTVSPYTKTVHGVLGEIAEQIGVKSTNTTGLHRKIGDRLSKTPGSLLIVDEAQNLIDAAVDQLRHFLDCYGCGIALVGNEEIYQRFSGNSDGPSYAQIKRRIGRRLRRPKPLPEDIAMLIDAWGIEDAKARKLLTGIGMKPGALGEIDKTCKLAGLLAAGDGEPITERYVRAAWTNRSVEG